MKNGVAVMMEIRFKPWISPNFAVPVGSSEGKPVKELGQAALDTMSEAWLKDLYEKAGKPNPWQKRGYR